MVGYLLAIALTLVLTAGCDLGAAGTSHAERIDVPLSVEMSLKARTSDECHKGCYIAYHVVITNQGTETAFARDCIARGLDAHGNEVVEANAGIGFPAGAEVTPDQPYQQDGTLLDAVTPEQRAQIVRLDATCNAYKWIGVPPA